MRKNHLDHYVFYNNVLTGSCMQHLCCKLMLLVQISSRWSMSSSVTCQHYSASSTDTCSGVSCLLMVQRRARVAEVEQRHSWTLSCSWGRSVTIPSYSGTLKRLMLSTRVQARPLQGSVGLSMADYVVSNSRADDNSSIRNVKNLFTLVSFAMNGNETNWVWTCKVIRIWTFRT